MLSARPSWCGAVTLLWIGGPTDRQPDSDKIYTTVMPVVMKKLEKIKKDQDDKKATKIKIAEKVIFPAVIYGSESWTVRKKERNNWCLWDMDAEEISKSSMDREENEFFSFGGSETQKITRSSNPPVKLHYFWHVMRAERSLERDIMLGQVAGYRKQGKPRMRWLDSIKDATGLRLDAFKEQCKIGKNGACWWRKRLGIGNTRMLNELRRRQWQTTHRQ